MYFFSNRYAYPVCGLYSLGHFIYLFIFLSLIALGLYLSRNISKKGIRLEVFIIACIITALELVKIGYNHAWGYFKNLDYWIPFSFCGLFLYTSWLSLVKCKPISDMAKIWTCVGGLFGGFCYLFYPSTSLTEVQAFHFLAVQSLTYHALMVYTGLLYLLHGEVKINLHNFLYYAIFLIIIFSIAIPLDYSIKQNFMFFYNAYNLPGFVQAIWSYSRPLYCVCIGAAHIFAPYFIIYFLCILMGKMHGKTKIKEDDVSSNKGANHESKSVF